MPDPVQKQLDAYNARDLDAFMQPYADDVVIEDGDGGEVLRGAEQMRAFYGDLFRASEELHAEILDRIEAGPWVIEEEHVRGVEAEGMPEEVHLAVAYKVEEGKITFVRLFM